MADVTTDGMDAEHASSLGRRYLIRFEEDTLRQRPLWIRLIIEFLGTFVLVTVAAGSGVINHYVGGGPISRTAAVIAPGAVVMAMIYAWGPLSGLHINPAVTFGFTARGVFPAKWVVPYWVVQFGGAICAALFLQLMFGDVSAGGNYPISTPGGEWKSLVMETVLTAILVSVILNTATGGRSAAWWTGCGAGAGRRLSFGRRRGDLDQAFGRSGTLGSRLVFRKDRGRSPEPGCRLRAERLRLSLEGRRQDLGRAARFTRRR